ncbi:MAG: ExbD/TolR family protein [Phycisphaerales bacterium JB052]
MMRRRSILNDEGASARVNVTPMIDVVMVLIVFYLLVGQLALDRRAAISLPASRTGVEETVQTDPIVIGVTRDGERSLNGDAIELDRIEAQVSGMLARSPSTPVRIRADRETPHRFVRPVLNVLRDMGVGRVELVTEKQP